MLTKDKLVCGCLNPDCTLPIEENEAEIIEDVEKDFPKIADGCQTKENVANVRLRKQIFDSMIP